MTLEVRGLRKRFAPGAAVLDGIDLTVTSGQLMCLLGESGAGKSTLLALLAGLEQPDGGTVHVDGRSIDHLPAHRRPLTLLLQTPQLFAHLDVTDNVAFGLRVRGMARSARRDRAIELLERVGAGHLAQRRTRALSGGEAQRVALARALAIEPAVLLADEPFASLDGPVRRELQELLRAVQTELGLTVVVVTHDVGEALALGDQVVVLAGGRIVEDGPPRQLYERPASDAAAAMLGIRNRWDALCQDRCLHLGPLRVPVDAPDGRGRWAIRSRHVEVTVADLSAEGRRSPGSTERYAGDAGAPGVIVAVRFAGSTQELTIEVDGWPIVAEVDGHQRWSADQPVLVRLATEHLFPLWTHHPLSPAPAPGGDAGGGRRAR